MVRMENWVGKLLLVCGLLMGSIISSVKAEPAEEFRQKIAPILEAHCLRCHSPGNSKGDISLATFDDLEENAWVIAGDPNGSELLELLSSDDNQRRMPKGSKPLTEVQLANIREWIANGAKWPRDIMLREASKADSTWWSWQPLSTQEPSSDTSAEIDRFVIDRLTDQGLSLNPPADRRTLIRRATFDLLGLPPTPAEVDLFLHDTRDDAFSHLIDRLLASPHYGERWGRHWLDVVRFGESIGYERNVIINNIWPFRDYVIRSINDDKPFDQFIREHLAGDVFASSDPEIAVGTAFLVAGPYDDVGNQDAAQAAQIRANTLDEIIRATTQAFLGITVGCARCHDHKFDPITQTDYYSLYATFAGIRHGAVELAKPEAVAQRDTAIAPLEERRDSLTRELSQRRNSILNRARDHLSEYESKWTRPPVDRRGTEEVFPDVSAKFVRLVCEAQDRDPNTTTNFRVDEFEIWSSGENPTNVALAANGSSATGRARVNEDFPEAYSAELAIDGRTGARFIAAGDDLTIELPQPTIINRVLFSSARGATKPDQGKFVFVAEYRIEVSLDGKQWQEVAHGRDRQPLPTKKPEDDDHNSHLSFRLLKLETTPEESAILSRLERDLEKVAHAIANVPALPKVWIGKRNDDDAAGPFHVFLGGNPQKKGTGIVPTSLSALADNRTGEPLHYRLPASSVESTRRLALANSITSSSHPLTARVLANRLWHYHFGTGIVDTPSDFGYMGGRPSHPELLDFLARQLIDGSWRIKAMHRHIMNTKTYQQSSDYRETAARVDGNARLLWRFPPRRLSAEEIRDTILQVTGALKTPRLSSHVDSTPTSDAPDHGPGFRLYHFMQDNVCTYVPLDHHGPDTFRRAVYHQNARAAIVDLMTDFDQPDCAFSTPKRAETTTPLQALTMLNHQFTLDMAEQFAHRLVEDAGTEPKQQVKHGFDLCFGREPTADELADCCDLLQSHGLPAFCRVLLNTSEMIYVR